MDFKKVVHNAANENAQYADTDSECSDSEKIGFIPAKEDKESGCTNGSAGDDEPGDKTDAAVERMLKEEEGRKKEAEDVDYSKAYGIVTTEEVTEQASQTEGEEFRILHHKCDSQSPGEELLLAYAHVLGFYCRVLTFGSIVINR